MKVLLISADPAVRETVGLTMRSLGRRGGAPPDVMEAADGVDGIRLAWRHDPDLVIADEICSRAGAFAVARDLKDAMRPLRGPIIILLDRAEDVWLARWSGADAWFVKPVNPFELADTAAALVAGAREEAV